MDMTRETAPVRRNARCGCTVPKMWDTDKHTSKKDARCRCIVSNLNDDMMRHNDIQAAMDKIVKLGPCKER